MFELIHVLTNNICFFLDDYILIYQDKENPDRTFIEITEDGPSLPLKDSARISNLWIGVFYLLSTSYSLFILKVFMARFRLHIIFIIASTSCF